DSFTYTVSDQYGGTSETATVALTLTNTDPGAQNDCYSNVHNLVLDVTGDPVADVITGVVPELNGDYDPDNVDEAIFEDTLTAALVDDVDFGTLVFNDDGTFTYTPDAGNTTGADSFTYTVSDEYGGTSNTATVAITLTNSDPVAQDDAYSNSHNLELDVTGDPIADVITGAVPELNGDYDPDNEADGKVFDDTLTAALVDDVDFGTLVFNDDGTFTYTPDAGNTTGADSFTYTVSDEYGGTSGTATVAITLTNQAPIAQPDGYATDQDTPLVVTVPEDVITGKIREINGDTDSDNETENRLFDDILSAIFVGNGTTALGGTVVLNDDGSFTYTPPAGGAGVDSFSYYVSDGYDNSNTVTVTVNVKGIPSSTPVPAIHQLEYPVLSGCPAEMAAAAAELAVNSDQLQMMINSAMASNPNMQACDACANLLTAAATLKQLENSPHVEAIARIFNELAPIDAPYTLEISADVETALGSFREMDSQLAMLTDEQYAEYQQSAMANELVEAFVSYVAVLENDLKLTATDSVAMVMDKYGEAVEQSGNPNIGTYLIEKMEEVRPAAEPVVASAE
ncbi:MAG: tandem-95 repeat protein, partial [Planctomycetota bacterium]